MAKIKSIHCISRASIKIKDSFYTIEYGEDREIEKDDNIVQEREKLWNDCNAEVDNQIAEIHSLLTKGKK